MHLGNAALVFTDSWASRSASLFCFMNSYANNRIQEDDSELNKARADATKNSISILKCAFFSQASPEVQMPEGANQTVFNNNLSPFYSLSIA